MIKKAAHKLRGFLWLLSGSDIEILKDCPTDYNRHANIGLSIAVTTMIAFCTGALAGYEFGDKTMFSALFFGCIWSLLVFAIDRTMVLTLKKNPSITSNERLKKMIIPVFYRIFLSALISFFISIPLELWLFRENIALQLEKDQSREKTDKQEREQSYYNISGAEDEVNDLVEESDSLNKLLNQPEPPANYKNYSGLKTELEKLNQNRNSLNIKYDLKTKERKIIKSQIELYNVGTDSIPKWEWMTWTPEYKKYIRLNREVKTLSSEINTAKNRIREREISLTDLRIDYFNKIENEKNITDSNKIIALTDLEVRNDSVKINTDEYAKMVDSQNGFTTKWVAINNIDEFWIIFFIWFIRIVFFTIEMLPTMAKITTPIGSYDWAVFRAESKKRKHLEGIEDLELENLKEKEILRQKIELKTQQKILKKIAEKQINIAEEILIQWEKVQKEKSVKDVDDLIADQKEEEE